MDCATPLVLAALAGAAPAHDPGVFNPPFARTLTPPPATGKAVWGAELTHHLSSENFTVAWDVEDLDEAVAERVSQALEQAWTALVEAQGWEPPTSSDDYLMWVILDPSISHTGYTSLLIDDAFPEGVPIIYMNPSYAGHGTFWEHLAVHEFSHMIQYGIRDWTGDADEAWYWEASAEWAAELAVPELDVYAVQTQYYTQSPHLAYDTINGGHEYGLSVLNAWLDEHWLGEGGQLSVWEQAQASPRDDWLEILEDATGLTSGELWAGFTAALANGTLREVDLYTPPVQRGSLFDGANGTSGDLEELGTDYWSVEEDAEVTVTGDAILGVGSESGASVIALAGEVLTVTALKKNASYSLVVGSVPDTADTGGPADSSPPTDSDPGHETGIPDDEGVGCGCEGSPRKGTAWPLLALLAPLLVRRTKVAIAVNTRV